MGSYTANRSAMAAGLPFYAQGSGGANYVGGVLFLVVDNDDDDDSVFFNWMIGQDDMDARYQSAGSIASEHAPSRVTTP